MANTIATNKVTNTYDNWGALLSEDYADSTTDVLYTRDKQGNVTDIKTGVLSSGTVASPQTRWSYSYNSAHAIETESLNVDRLTFALNPEYNALGQLNTLTYPNNTVISEKK